MLEKAGYGLRPSGAHPGSQDMRTTAGSPSRPLDPLPQDSPLGMLSPVRSSPGSSCSGGSGSMQYTCRQSHQEKKVDVIAPGPCSGVPVSTNRTSLHQSSQTRARPPGLAVSQSLTSKSPPTLVQTTGAVSSACMGVGLQERSQGVRCIIRRLSADDA